MSPLPQACVSSHAFLAFVFSRLCLFLVLARMPSDFELSQPCMAAFGSRGGRVVMCLNAWACACTCSPRLLPAHTTHTHARTHAHTHTHTHTHSQSAMRTSSSQVVMPIIVLPLPSCLLASLPPLPSFHSHARPHPLFHHPLNRWRRRAAPVTRHRHALTRHQTRGGCLRGGDSQQRAWGMG